MVTRARGLRVYPEGVNATVAREVIAADDTPATR